VLQQLFNFLVLGSVYSIVALGFTLYFGTANLVNFAHGDLCTLSAFLFLLSLSLLFGNRPAVSPIGFLLVALVVVLISALIGLLSERLLFRPLRKRPLLEGLIVSIGFSMLIRESILYLYPNGGNPQPFPDPFLLRSLQIFGVNVAYLQLFLIVICAVLALMFFWVVQKTNFGRFVRAISQDPEAAMMIGIPVNRTVGWIFALGASFAAVAGILHGSLYGSVKFDMGIYLGVKGFVAAVIGGLDNPRGALFGGLFLALLETLVVGYVPSGSGYRDIIAFSLLLAFMLIRPAGLVGSKV
jgi:branched-chain amino acid transport system permease protein